MDLVVALIALVAFIASWVYLNNKMKMTRSTITRHCLGFLGGLFSFCVVIIVALTVGIIESDAPESNQKRANVDNSSKMSFSQMMADRNDFSIEAGTLKILSESPLKVELLEESMIDQSNDIKEEDINRAIIYAVYRTFMHTSEEHITVTAYPLDIISLIPKKVEENHDVKMTVSVSRQQALQAIQSLVPTVNSFDDMFELASYEGMKVYEWSDDVKSFYWERNKQEQLIQTLLAFKEN